MTSTTTKKLSIFFYPIDATGHLNSCIGLGQELATRGHTVSLLFNVAFKGSASSYGLNEILLTDKPKPETGSKVDPTVSPVKLLAQQLQSSGLLSGADSHQKLKYLSTGDFIEDAYQRMAHFNSQIEDAITRESPDLIIVDHMMVPPAILASGIPYVIILSTNPIMMYNSPLLPPPFSGYPTKSDPSSWIEYQETFEKSYSSLISRLQERLNEQFNYVPERPVGGMSGLCGFAQSPYLNIYGYPEELGYQDVLPLPEKLIAVDTFCRKTPKPFKIPEKLKVQPGDKLIYVSMGSLGSIDVKLNKRVASVLAKTPYKVIFSKGPLADEYELPDNCWGEAHLPQTSILPLVDLCITHGGNNTVTETFSFGVPMIVLPLFADQFDNAQRIDEKGFGVRLEPYSFTEEEMITAIEKLLNDDVLKQKLKTAAKRIESSNSKARACEQLERLVEKYLYKA